MANSFEHFWWTTQLWVFIQILRYTVFSPPDGIYYRIWADAPGLSASVAEVGWLDFLGDITQWKYHNCDWPTSNIWFNLTTAFFGSFDRDQSF